MMNVEQAIAEVANVYQSLTGHAIKPGRYELPPEVDPMGQAESNYRQFKALLEQRADFLLEKLDALILGGNGRRRRPDSSHLVICHVSH